MIRFIGFAHCSYDFSESVAEGLQSSRSFVGEYRRRTAPEVPLVRLSGPLPISTGKSSSPSWGPVTCSNREVEEAKEENQETTNWNLAPQKTRYKTTSPGASY